ncbi:MULTISPECIES: DUF1501 domain-containing protein [Acidiphilium]|uniref:Uncharacterized conserved protein, DUF1501 family n=1 Tax=Acidiphilium rubrum TaxID=526 RepID=A0A8G2CI97_ACIRU|nr:MULTISPECIES: DUF1501 domain-containing protein [Acidiphilium]SIQ21315.1 Uncharacterized conserved protein, DUF1501 family [Acidiphilium rubrum]
MKIAQDSMNIALTRRASLLGLATIAVAGRAKLALASAPTEQRLVVVLLRGALDGMAAVVPYGDPNLQSLRAALVPPQSTLLDLGGFFAFHPALKNLHALYQQNEVLPVHAIAGPYRTRSHFEAQDFLQTGIDQVGITSGWLNRLIAELPSGGVTGQGLAVGMGMPLLLRGPTPVASYAPAGFAKPSPALYANIAALNRPDPMFGPAIAEGLRAARFDHATLDDPSMDDAADHTMAAPPQAYGFPALARAAGTLLAAPGGPRIAAFQLEGWDTHGNQMNLLHPPLADLDAGIATLRTAMGPAWANTTILVITEFGRTARINGTHGTDHGTATVAFLAGGCVAGGKIRTTWPGLNPTQLFQNRDLAPTADIRSLAKGVIQAQFHLTPTALARVFPNSSDAAPMAGLLRV